MTSKGSDRLFELPTGVGGEPFEESNLRRRTSFQSRAARSGADFKAMTIARIREAGGTIERTDFEIGGFPIDALISGTNGRRFLVLARGTPEEYSQSGLRRTDTVEKTGYMAMQLARRQHLSILVITSDLPERSTKAGHYLAALSDDVVDVIGYRADFRGYQRLREHLHGAADAPHPDAPWRLPVGSNEASLFDDDAVLPGDAPRPALNDDKPR